MDKKSALKEFKKIEKNNPAYINPWGIYGGLFSSALLVLILLTAYAAGGVNVFDIVVVSIVALLGGALHSRTLAALNTEATAHAMALASLGRATDTLQNMHELIVKQRKEIERLSKK